MIYISILVLSSIFCLACNQSSNNSASTSSTSTQKTELDNTDIAARLPTIQQSLPDTLKYCISDSSLGAGGYDLVNYFKINLAVVGSSAFTETYDGVDYYFTSDGNKNLFKENPERYLPAYGGWCSMTLAMGRATQPTYDNFKIINGTLHLFERTLSINGQTLWVTDPDENEKLAGRNYADYLDDGLIIPE